LVKQSCPSCSVTTHGLNGKRYVLDNDGDVMLFSDKEHAKRFVAEHGENPNDEYIDYEEYD